MFNLKRLTTIFILCFSFLAFSRQWHTNQSATEGEAPIITSQELQSGVKISIDIKGAYTQNIELNGEAFQSIEIPDFSMTSLIIGKPSVPAKTFTFKMPLNSTAEVVYNVTNSFEVNNLNLFPVQPFPNDLAGAPDPEFTKDEITYSTNALYPASNIISKTVSTMRNYQMLTISVTPIQVNPVTKVATISDLDISINFIEGAPASGLAPTNSFARLVTKDMSQRGISSTAPEKYLIIADDHFGGNRYLHDFITWKSKKGYDVEFVKTSDINSNGAPTKEEIQQFIRSKPNDQYPSYLLLIGDHTAHNGVEGWFINTMKGGYSDLNYSLKDDNDIIPDLFVGRIPARSDRELDLMMKKILTMDRTPQVRNHYDKVLVLGELEDARKISPAPDVFVWSNDEVANRLFAETSDAIASFFENNSTDVNRVMYYKTDLSANCVFNPNSILWNENTKISSTIFNSFVDSIDQTSLTLEALENEPSLVFHRDHGNFYGWGGPSFNYQDVDDINSENYPFILSVNCLTGGYHHGDSSFVNKWLFDKSFGGNLPYGAYAFIGAVDVSYSWVNDYFSHALMMGLKKDYRSFVDGYAHKTLPQPVASDNQSVEWGLIEGSATKLGHLLHYAKLYVYQIYNINKVPLPSFFDQEKDYVKFQFELYHLFGDPEAEVVFEQPVAINPSYTQEITGNNAETVTIDAGSEDLLVCLYSPKLGVHQSKYTNSDGKASFDLPAFGDKGYIAVTITGYKKIPYEGDIRVGADATLEEMLQFSTKSTWNLVEGDATVELVSNAAQVGEKNLQVTINSGDFATIQGTKLVDHMVGSNAERIKLRVKLSFPEDNTNTENFYRGNLQFLAADYYNWYNWVGQFDINSAPVSVDTENGMCYADYEFVLPNHVTEDLKTNGLNFQLRLSAVISGEWFILEELAFEDAGSELSRTLSASLNDLSIEKNIAYADLEASIVNYDQFLITGSEYGLVYRDVLWKEIDGSLITKRCYYQIKQDVDRPMYLVENWAKLPAYGPEAPTGYSGYWRQCWKFIGLDQ